MSKPIPKIPDDYDSCDTDLPTSPKLASSASRHQKHWSPVPRPRLRAPVHCQAVRAQANRESKPCRPIPEKEPSGARLLRGFRSLSKMVQKFRLPCSQKSSVQRGESNSETPKESALLVSKRKPIACLRRGLAIDPHRDPRSPMGAGGRRGRID